jgi:hypothetical protein
LWEVKEGYPKETWTYYLSVDLRKKETNREWTKGIHRRPGLEGKRWGEIRKRWGKEMWRKEGGGKKRGVCF